MRQKILFDDSWLFHCGDITYDFPKDKGFVYASAKTESETYGPASVMYGGGCDVYDKIPGLDTRKWQNVNLPHDYTITQTPNPNENNALGFFSYQNAWYRKKFKLSEDDSKKRITLLFEAVSGSCCVYLNGCPLKRNFCGYASFEVDISDFALYGESENVLAVYINSSKNEGWWYEGCGIYRHVWLIKTNEIAVDLWGIYAPSKKINDTDWLMEINTDIINSSYESASLEIKEYVYDANGNKIACGKCSLDISAQDKATSHDTLTIKNPKLWDINSPNLYSVTVEIFKNSKLIDSSSTRTGFRTFFADGSGFFLNGRKVFINGMCAHQDFGLTGRAVPDNIARYKIELIKQMGANGYRTTHYPHSEATMDALDETGFIVMDETRHFSSCEDSLSQLDMLVRRDRNRPSVMFWSIGNEEPHHLTKCGEKICKRMSARIKKLDKTRYVCSAVSNNPKDAKVFDFLDAVCINYNLDDFDILHKKYPEKPILSSECCATSTTRGFYMPDSFAHGYFSSYDKDTDSWFLSRQKTMSFLTEKDYVCGFFQWIAFEHRGETKWPRLCSQAGAIDLYLQKKDAFYQNQSYFVKDRPVVHLLPHWNFTGLEGEKIRVICYTNCEEAELFLNGKSLGSQNTKDFAHGEWFVGFKPGTLCVKAKNGGKVVCSDEKTTSGKAEKLSLVLENKTEFANGRDVALLSCFCIDAFGNEVYDADAFVKFYTNELGSVIATDSDVCDHTAPHVPERKMRAGRISVAVRVGSQKGILKVYAESSGFPLAVKDIELK